MIYFFLTSEECEELIAPAITESTHNKNGPIVENYTYWTEVTIFPMFSIF